VHGTVAKTLGLRKWPYRNFRRPYRNFRHGAPPGRRAASARSIPSLLRRAARLLQAAPDALLLVDPARLPLDPLAALHPLRYPVPPLLPNDGRGVQDCELMARAGERGDRPADDGLLARAQPPRCSRHAGVLQAPVQTPLLQMSGIRGGAAARVDGSRGRTG